MVALTNLILQRLIFDSLFIFLTYAKVWQTLPVKGQEINILAIAIEEANLKL